MSRFVLRRALAVVLLLMGPAANGPAKDPVAAKIYGYKVVKEYPHDSRAFCQGLAFHDDRLYEGTGQYGGSSLRMVTLETGRPAKVVTLPRRLFGEGVTLWKDQVIQLTWKSRTGIVYDRATLKEVKRFKYQGEGWGITHDDKQLIMSDGSSVLRFLDPVTFRVTRRLRVEYQGQQVRALNELEYINGEIWANIWYQDYIARISPASGEVVSWIDLRTLYPRAKRAQRDQVLNGIAYDAQRDRIFVTGKYWPQLFEIEVTEP